MRDNFAKILVSILIAVSALALGFFTISLLQHKKVVVPAPVVVEQKQNPERKIIGYSVEKRTIEAYVYNGGGLASAMKKILFVGGIHGGYEWNSVVLAYDLMDYLRANPDVIPANLEVTVIPNANPDGVFKIIGKEGRFNLTDVPAIGDQSPGRFNAHNVDLNRNFDCNWSVKGMWQGKSVGTGTAAFSEPESQALRDYILANKPDVAVFYHSAANAVYGSQCKNGILPETTKVLNVYAKAAGYKAVPVFDAYKVNGASEDWLASQNIPAITVELASHKTVEWEKNLLGIRALLEFYK